jgi:hypothetical protein
MPTLYTADEAGAERFDTPDLAENGASTASGICIKSVSPMILMSVVSTNKTNAGDPTRRDAEGGSAWLHYRIRHRRARAMAARVS